MLLPLDLNIFNYLAHATIPQSAAPRSEAEHLKVGLIASSDVEGRGHTHQFYSERDQSLRQKLSASLSAAYENSRRYFSGEGVILGHHQTKEILDPVQKYFSELDRSPIALAIVGDGPQLKNALSYLERENREMPCFVFDRVPDVVDVIDPLPPVELLRDVSMPSPQFIFWSARGTACCLPLDRAMEVCNQLAYGSDETTIESMIKHFQLPRMRATTILHLSDLHYGSDEAIENERYLFGHIKTIASQVDKIVITGDLAHQPRRRYLAGSINFCRQLQEIGKEVIIIPGNHDVRTSGLAVGPLGRFFRWFAELEWSSIVVDDDQKVVFFCFDSAAEGNLAKGRVSERQLLSVATDFDIRRERSPPIDTYFKIALVHHHPFSYEIDDRNLVRALLSKFSPDDEIYLRLEGAEQFVTWCQRRGVQIILHGHKHIPRLFRRTGPPAITCVGCGTSTGVEARNLSYVVVGIDHKSKRHSTAFYQGQRDGSGFVDEIIQVKMV